MKMEEQQHPRSDHYLLLVSDARGELEPALTAKGDGGAELLERFQAASEHSQLVWVWVLVCRVPVMQAQMWEGRGGLLREIVV